MLFRSCPSYCWWEDALGSEGSSRRGKHLSTKLPEYLDPDLLQAAAAVAGLKEQASLRLPKMGETDPPAEVGFDE